MPTLDWIGKNAVVGHHHEVPYRLIHCDGTLSAGDPHAGNLLVEGDNLVALKALLPYYAGKVKCIYIDPPYNTGSENWVYNDNVNSPEIVRWLGETVGKEAEDLSRHDKWLCMMYPRLVLLREFLTTDGAIFISCDDNEFDHARQLCDEVFGRRSFMAPFVWQSKDTPGNNASGIAEMHNYLLAYRRSEEHAVSLLARNEDQIANYSNPDHDPREDWLGSPLTRAEHRDRDYYPIQNKAGRDIFPPPGSSWRRPPATMKRLQADNRIWWGKDGDSSFPLEKKFLKEAKEGVVQRTWWTYQYAGSTRNASAELKAIFDGRKVFDTPKPILLIKRILELFGDDEMLVLDAFAGTGTTGHAVLEKNVEDGGRRRFLLVEMEPSIASTVTAVRLKRAVEGYRGASATSLTLLEKKLTVSRIRQGERIVDEFEKERERRAEEFEQVDIVIEDDAIKLTGRGHKGGSESGALGGGFRYCNLGEPLFDADGSINPTVTFPDLAAHVFFAETGQPIPKKAENGNPFLGTFQNRAVYLLWSREGASKPGAHKANILAAEALGALLPLASDFSGERIVYADGCTVSRERLTRDNIVFKQVPYRVAGN